MFPGKLKEKLGDAGNLPPTVPIRLILVVNDSMKTRPTRCIAQACL